MTDSRADQKHRVLVVGCGSIGKRHIRNLKTLGAGEIAAFDVQAERRAEAASIGGVRAVEDLAEAWSWNPDVALVTVPNSFHLPMAMEAARRDCHLFIEKPLSHRLDGVEDLLNIVRDRKLVTLVGCNMRFHPGLKRIKALLDEGAIGRVVAARVEGGQYLPDWHPWEDYRRGYSARAELGGGIILDGVHEIDYLRWMLGEVGAVACFAGHLARLDIDTEDTAGILLRFLNGTIGELHLDYVQRIYSRSVQIVGDEGTIRWDYTTGEVRWYSAEARGWQVFPNPPDWEANQMYLDEMRHFLRCLTREERPLADVWEGKRTLQVALAAKASSACGEMIQLGG
ncbi:MAG TPA: Gfo/Idh/MocA family oxidoreductase [Candidatus Binatia bacterium]|jgi:predicted dehydrogenase